MKVCNHKLCKREHDTKWKTCPNCRRICRRSKAKRREKRKTEKKEVAEGFKSCICCFKIKPNADFESKIYRRKKMTSKCEHCRKIQKKTKKNPSTKRGQCRAFWQNWKKEQKCVDCGTSDSRLIEADHTRKPKIHNVSDYAYWAWNGGVDAMRKELEKCVPRCRICHTLKTKERRDFNQQKEGRKLNPVVQRRRKEIDIIKLKIGKCNHCLHKVTSETCCAFDFDHKDEEKKIICISKLAYKSKKFYDEHLYQEIAKCQLLCRNCHHLKTHYPEEQAT